MIIYLKGNKILGNKVIIKFKRKLIYMSKLLPIAELIKQLLELEFKKKDKYTLES